MKVIIVGGVAGGASAAARARRLSEDADIILFERGSAPSFANCGMPYYIGVQLQALGIDPTKDHRPQSSVADRQRLGPCRDRLAIPERGRVVRTQ